MVAEEAGSGLEGLAGGEGLAADAGAAGEGAAAGGEGLASGETVGGEPGDTGVIEYGDFVLPEGVTVNPDLLGEFKTTLAGLKLTQEQAQLVADLGVKQAQSILAQLGESQAAEQAALSEAFSTGDGALPAAEFVQPAVIAAQVEKWQAAVLADKELGGEKLASTVATAMKAVEALGSPALKQLFDKSGLGSHPEVVRAFYKAGLLLSEDGVVTGGAKPAGAVTGRTAFEQQANVLFG